MPDPTQTRSAPSSDPIAADSARAPLTAGEGIVLLAVVLRELVYRELPLPEGESPVPVAPGLPVPVATNFTGQLGLAEGGVAELTLRLVLGFDMRQQPLQFEAAFSAQFRRPDAMTVRDYLRWLSHAGVRLLYPYFRELVSSVTGRGIYGGLLLNPAVLNPIMSDEEIDRLLAEQKPREATVALTPERLKFK